MKGFSVSIYLLLALGLTVHHVISRYTKESSEFKLDGDFLLGGLFNIHLANGTILDRPEAMDCSSQPINRANYRRFQVMRFTIEEINNSTVLLPNVKLGYEILDHCSPIYNFPGVLDLISFNGSIRFSWEASDYRPLGKVMGVIGASSSADSLAIAPLFTLKLIPLISYAASSSALSLRDKYPAFLRTISSTKDLVDVIIQVLQHFKWTWVALLHSAEAFGKDGLEVCIHEVVPTEICLAYIAAIDENTNFLNVFQQIDLQNISVIVVYSVQPKALALIEAAVVHNVTNKVWIATDTWFFSKSLTNRSEIERIGTIVGISEKTANLSGFVDFINSKNRSKPHNVTDDFVCEQDCNCDDITGKDILAEEDSYNFQVYTATYAIAQALHNVLQCDRGKCKVNGTVYPYMVLNEVKKTNLTLLNMTIQFNEFGGLKFPSVNIFVLAKGVITQVGSYETNPTVVLSINNSLIQWHANGTVPESVCSPECDVGYVKTPEGIHRCCFTCEKCKNGTYVNITASKYLCQECSISEWSLAGSTSCQLRSVEYIPYSHPMAILIIVGAMILAALSLAIAVLFLVHHNTPVVKSAGGLMCFIILVSLALCTISIFFYFEKPSTASCILRYLPFMLFYTACLACFWVHAFQIVCAFKMAAKFPKFYSLYMKHHGQWWLIALPVLLQAVLLTTGYASSPPHPVNQTDLYPDKILLACGLGHSTLFSMSAILLVFLVVLCFALSYMGKDLPKNYNEAKAITFCLLLLILTWVFFLTEYTIYHGEYIQTLNALAVLFSLYAILVCYFLPKCYIILFQPQNNTPHYFQELIHDYTKQISSQ
ncbi:unnamed protein product [Arctogadus glacialis]